MSEIAGQLSIYDAMAENEKRKPCEYNFQRYIGQRVRFSGDYHAHHGEVGTITGIGKYYTDIKMDDGRELAGTPYDISPAEKGE